MKCIYVRKLDTCSEVHSLNLSASSWYWVLFVSGKLQLIYLVRGELFVSVEIGKYKMFDRINLYYSAVQHIKNEEKTSDVQILENFD
jgi:hypothetical protein